MTRHQNHLITIIALIVAAACGEVTPVDQPCDSSVTTLCVDGDLYTEDLCEGTRVLEENCGGLGCEAGACLTASCTAEATFRCQGDDVYWFDSCDTQGAIKEDCADRGCSDLACLGAEGTPRPVAHLAASKLSGVAPLGVLFDATATTHGGDADVNAFVDLTYAFNFGDTSSGTWTHSGLSKNVQEGGALAAHVFDTPGTYSVSVVVQDDAGESSTATLSIEVEDPDLVFAGEDTLCLSTGTAMDGCPAGARLLPSLNAWPTFESNKRYLLRAGDDFMDLGGV